MLWSALSERSGVLVLGPVGGGSRLALGNGASLSLFVWGRDGDGVWCRVDRLVACRLPPTCVKMSRAPKVACAPD